MAMFNSKLLNYQRVARNLLRACNLYTHVDVSAQSSWANVDIPLPWLPRKGDAFGYQGAEHHVSSLLSRLLVEQS